MIPFPGLRGGGAAGLRPQDVFATSLYTGTANTLQINNGLDLAGKGGLTWGKGRSVATLHQIYDSVRGIANGLRTSTTDVESAYGDISSFNSNGITLSPQNGQLNSPGATFVNWSFCRAPKFFDIVTYTGDGTTGRQIPHALGVVPGMMIFKRRDAVEDWWTYHRGNVSPNANWWQNYLKLNGTGAVSADPNAPGQPTASNIVVNGDFLNASGKQYVVYLFAHDPDTTNGIVQCGSFVTGSPVMLGWQPQLLLIKDISAVSDWFLNDSTRGLATSTSGSNPYLRPNSSASETNAVNNSTAYLFATPTGFSEKSYYVNSGDTAIYLAIRAPV